MSALARSLRILGLITVLVFVDWASPPGHFISRRSHRYTGKTESGRQLQFHISTVQLSENVDARIPGSFSLSQNFPNPFNPSTMILYELPNRSSVNISVFNILGQLVSTLVREEKNAGKHSVSWNGKTDGGTWVSSGVYFYRIYARSLDDVTDFTATKKLILLR